MLLARLATLLLLPLALASCVLTPGQFTSTLSIDADRSFRFSYVGEVIQAAEDIDTSAPFGDLGKATDKPDDAASLERDKARKKAETERKNRALAAALAKEAGYRKVTYLGDGVFMIDYAITGTLDHGFFWPFNVDAEAILPFIAIELRQDGVVRVKAPAFANEVGKGTPGVSAMPGADAMKGVDRLDGVFTFDTNADIISQSSEDGVTTTGTGPTARKTMTWRATPALKTPPTVVLRLGL